MSGTDPRADEYFAAAGAWGDAARALRDILLECPVVEAFKWRSPCYTTVGGKNVVALWTLKDSCALAFFKGVLLEDAEGLLGAPGAHSRSMRVMKFSSVADIVASDALVKRYVREAVAAEEAGQTVAFPTDDLDLPPELVDRMGRDPDLKAAFEALTPGRRRGYVLHVSRARQSGTRVSRIEKCVPRILAGKGLHDR